MAAELLSLSSQLPKQHDPFCSVESHRRRRGAHLPPATRLSLKGAKDLSAGDPYFTLSHCWGGTVPLRLLRENMSSMERNIPLDHLPKTFQDAVIVTQKLGVRYLWIDSLCIVQDDADDWQHESALMIDVYRNATCNISAAASSNSSEGLFLDRDSTLAEPIKANFRTDRTGFVPHDFWPEYIWTWGLETGPLMSRGWVLQERTLSRRNLHFRRDQVVWECRSDATCETFPCRLPFKEIPRPLKHKFSQVLFGDERSMREVMEAWDRTVSKYTALNLTCATDKLIALGGLAKTFSSLLWPRYLAGLWLKNLAYQLCWRGKRDQATTFVAPSWSWASTRGQVTHAFLPIHLDSTVRQLDVIEANTDLVSFNSYGQVKGGYLRVAARDASGKLQHQGTLGLPLWLPNSRGEYSATGQSLSLSWTEDELVQSQRQSGGQVLILAVLEYCNASREHGRAMAGQWQMDKAARTQYKMADTRCCREQYWDILSMRDVCCE